MRELKFAFISDGEVFHYLSLQDDPAFEGIIAGLRSGPMLVELPEGSDFLPPGTKYENGEFILPEVQMPKDDYEVED